MKNRKSKFMTALTLFLLCLNVFCLNSICAYADFASLDSKNSLTLDASHDNHMTDTSNDCCGLCCGIGCLSHHSFICSNQLIVVSLNTATKYPKAEDDFIHSVFLKSIPKPPCPYSLV